jgi:hypothetical protein
MGSSWHVSASLGEKGKPPPTDTLGAWIFIWPAGAQVAAIDKSRTSSLELIETCLEGIRRLDLLLNALVTLDMEPH